MAKKASKSGSRPTKGGSKSRAVADRRGSGGRRASAGGGRRTSDNAGDAFIKLLQSPLVAELVAVAATAALAALAEQGFTRSGSDGSRGRRAGNAVKQAGKAAAAAIGRRLSTEIDEIKKASKPARRGAKA